MFQSLQLTLSVSIVPPLVDFIRKQAAALETSGPFGSPGEAKRYEASLAEVRTFLALFDRNFSETGSLFILENKSPAVLRACAILRLQLRSTALALISDQFLESSLDPADFTGEDHTAVMSYAFLGTLQETIIGHYSSPSIFQRWVGRAWNDFALRVRSMFSRTQASDENSESAVGSSVTSKNTDSWQVVVLNDPVNLMRYVTVVFELVLFLPEEIAKQRMLEVHESKHSKLWVGPRDKAVAYVRDLRAWHLNAVVRPPDDA